MRRPGHFDRVGVAVLLDTVNARVRGFRTPRLIDHRDDVFEGANRRENQLSVLAEPGFHELRE